MKSAWAFLYAKATVNVYLPRPNSFEDKSSLKSDDIRHIRPTPGQNYFKARPLTCLQNFRFPTLIFWGYFWMYRVISDNIAPPLVVPYCF